MHKIVQTLDWPAVPQELTATFEPFIKKIIADNPPHPNPLCRRTMTVTQGDQEIHGATYRGNDAPADIKHWVEENICRDFLQVRIASHGEEGSISVPHTDASRDWTALYITDLGGNQVETVFWQEQGQDLRRPRATFPASYNNLVEIQRECFPKNSWVLLDARVIHSIENMQGLRIGLQIGFSDNCDTIKNLVSNF